MPVRQFRECLQASATRAKVASVIGAPHLHAIQHEVRNNFPVCLRGVVNNYCRVTSARGAIYVAGGYDLSYDPWTVSTLERIYPLRDKPTVEKVAPMSQLREGIFIALYLKSCLFY